MITRATAVAAGLAPAWAPPSPGWSGCWASWTGGSPSPATLAASRSGTQSSETRGSNPSSNVANIVKANQE